MQDIINIVVMSDKNNDQRFCKVEAKTLALKIRLQLQEYGVEFDEVKFFNVMSVNPTITGVIAIVQKLIPSLQESKTSEEEKDDDDFDMFRMSTEVGQATGALNGSITSSPRGRRQSISLALVCKSPKSKTPQSK